jgi:hypothetical protein
VLSGNYYETISSIKLLYDDTLNVDGSYLLFSTENPIKAIGRYETPNIQKVYWTDGYNNLRYINISKYATTTGSDYTLNDYWGVDKFELLPIVSFTKPVVSEILPGNIPTGMVYYAYMLVMKNGASSAISPISDPVHVVTDDDYLSNDVNYNGDGMVPIKTKGFRLTIDLTGNTGFDKLQLLRIYYPSYSATPSISIASEISITGLTTASVIDIGNTYGELTVDEFNIMSTELFKCEDITSKDNTLFAGNITKNDFTIDNFDARAVRFRNYADTTTSSETITNIIDLYTDDQLSGFLKLSDYDFTINLPDTYDSFGIPTSRTITGISSMTCRHIHIYYYDSDGIPRNAMLDDDSGLSGITYTYTNPTTLMNVSTIDQLFFYEPVILSSIWIELSITYTYTGTGTSVIESIVTDVNFGNRVINSSLSNWSILDDTHDCINNYNNPDNDFNALYQFKYQSDGITIGAEGPNILIGIGTEEFDIDTVNTDAKTYNAKLDTVGSFTNYASPFNAGKLSWQRDEVYRIFIVFRNNRGQYANPKWICDFRVPSMQSTTYGVLVRQGTPVTTTESIRLYLTAEIKDGCWPTDAVSAQIYRVPRNRMDRQVVTQCVAIGCGEADVKTYGLNDVTDDIPTYSTDNENLIKLISPEILVNKNIVNQTSDYLEYVGSYDTLATCVVQDYDTSADGNFFYLKAVQNLTKSSLAANDRSDIKDSVSIVPITKMGAGVNIGGYTFQNYAFTSVATDTVDAMGCTGLAVQYDNNSFNIEGIKLPIINYKSQCWNSQYGGNTYEARINNSSIPCSELMIADNTTYKCEYGDTYISYLDIASLLFDLKEHSGSAGAWANSCHQALYIPFESSINCNLRYDKEGFHIVHNNLLAQFQQEEMGAHSCYNDSTDTTRIYEQKENLYSYNTVYSQQPLFASQICVDESVLKETVFDCQIKASNTKINGESVDSWTKFGVNDFIEVDSEYGSLNALYNYNGIVFFWQDKSFGRVAINDRSVIQDNSSAKLVLGTGGKLERYDYLSLMNGCTDKFSVVGGSNGLYWVDRDKRNINRFANSLLDLSTNKGVKSVLEVDKDIVDWPKYISVQDRANNEILFTFANYENGTITSPGTTEYAVNKPFTICLNEVYDQFTSNYTFVPNIYIPYKNTFLTNTIFNPNDSTLQYPANLLFVHNVDEGIQCRNNFYGLTYASASGNYPSKLTLLFNPYYSETKVFDNLFFQGNITYYPKANTTYKKDYAEYDYQDICPIYSIAFNNTYQNTGTLIVPTNLEIDRRERLWTTYIPRNAVRTVYGSQYLNPEIETLTPTRTDYRERMRDKYLTCKITTPTNTTDSVYSQRVVFENIGVSYRKSYR